MDIWIKGIIGRGKSARILRKEMLACSDSKDASVAGE